MPELNQLDIHSEEVQEIMGKIPGWILRWGLSVIFSIILLIVIGSYFLRFPEIVNAPLIITTYNTPAALKANATGKIEKILVENEQVVKKGDVIAIIKNSANYKDILAVDSFIVKIGNDIDWMRYVKEKEISSHYSLGEVQTVYINFQKKCREFNHYLKQNLLPIKYNLLEEQIESKKEIFNKTLIQYDLMQQDLELAYNSFKRDSILFMMKSQVLNKSTYESSLQAYLLKKASFVNFEKNIKSSELEILVLKESLVELRLKYQSELNQYNLSLDESWQILRNSIDQWKEKYVIFSPIVGKITFTNFWNINQNINTGDRLATIVPLNETRIIAKAIVSSSGMGKVNKGQEVHIKLSGFPSMQYGMLKGKITNISLVPEEDGYVALIDITGGMKSSYKEHLKFYQEMSGTAEILTEKRRLISRFIKPLKMMQELSEK